MWLLTNVRVVIVCTILSDCHAYWTELEFVSIENMNVTGPIQYNFRIKRITRHQFGITGTIILGEFLQYMAEGKLFFSAKADGQYTLTPFKVAPVAMCDGINEFYVKKVMTDLKDFSDMPQVNGPGPEVCDMFTNVSGDRVGCVVLFCSCLLVSSFFPISA